MLTENQKRRLENHIYNLLRESLWENFIGEESDGYEDNSELSYRGNEEEFHKKKKHNKNKHEHSDSKGDGEKKHNGKKRKEVMAWLSSSEDEDTLSYSLNHADIMRKLWHPKDKEEEDELRSLFSKKLNHSLNDNGSEYDFSDEEINTLYNIKGGIV